MTTEKWKGQPKKTFGTKHVALSMKGKAKTRDLLNLCLGIQEVWREE